MDSEPIYILHINSTTQICSVALSDGDNLIQYRETGEANSHTEVITVFVEELMKQSGISFNELSAVSLAAGPGSYTSLRVGCATAKGICYGSNIPLITIPSLDILASSCIADAQKGDYIIPMIDARRMEVYTAIYDHMGNKIEADHAHILDDTSFNDWGADKTTIHVVGNGAEKSLEVLSHFNIKYHKNFSSARFMIVDAYEAFRSRQFSDLSYFEPFYLKGANVTKSKKKYF